jgi:hypothetical protein
MDTTPPNYDTHRSEYAKEREFLESVMNTRFNFLLVVYALILTAAASAKTTQIATFILIDGLIVCTSLALATHRAYTVVLPIIKAMKADSTTPLAWAIQQASKSHPLSRTANAWIGAWIPAFCFASLAFALVALWMGVWSPR